MIDFAQLSPVNYIQNDLKVARIVTPVKNEEYGLETITVKVLNQGKDILNGFNLAYEINGHFPPVKQFFDYPVIPYGDSVMVSFDTKADLSKYGIYKIVTYGVDNNDDYIFNDTLSVNIENIRINETLSVFPNPFTDVLTININSQVDDKLDISFTNVSGVKFYNFEKNILTGNNSFTITGLRLAPALYYLKIRGTSINKTIPVLKTNK